MFINLLHTLTLATSVGIGAVAPNFNIEKKQTKKEINRSIASDTLYEEWVIPNNWIAKKTIIGSYTKNETNYSYGNLTYYSYGVNTQNTPAEYMQIKSRNYVLETWNEEGTSLVEVTTESRKEINDEITTYIGRYQKTPMYYQRMEINPINVNENVTIRVMYESALTNFTEVHQYWKTGLRIFIFTTTTKLYEGLNDGSQSGWGQINGKQLQENQYYSGTKFSDLVVWDYEQPVYMDYWNYNYNPTIVYGKTNYIYFYAEPVYIVPERIYSSLTNKYVYQTGQIIDYTIPPVQHPWYPLDGYEDNISEVQYRINGLNRVVENYEVIDMGGLVFTILGMPFTFISTAFNLTLFEGTPYQINFSTLFLSIFAVIVFVFIIKLILGAVGNK